MILTQMGEPFTRAELPALTQYRPCNPSVIRHGNGYLSTVRGCNYDLRRGYHFTIGSAPSTVPDSQNYLARLTSKLQVESYEILEDRHIRADARALDGIEDLRLFMWKGEPHVLGTALHYTPKPKNTMVLCRLADGALRDPVYLRGPGSAPVEKNWMPLVRGTRLFFVYRASPFSLWEYDGGDLILTASAEPQGWPADISGSSCMMPYEDGYLAVVHRKTIEPRKKSSVYRHHLIKLDANMQPLHFGRRFTFEDENVEFCAGLVIDGDDVVFSYGVMDQKAVHLKMHSDIIGRLM